MNAPRKPTQIACFGLACLVFASGCATTPQGLPAKPQPSEPPRPRESRLPSLESHFAAEWISTAARIDSGDSAIYYRGSALAGSDGEPWTGTVHGEILLVSPRQAILIPSGTLTLQNGKIIKVVGAHRTRLTGQAETPIWQSLLPASR